jgi:hypothetical protein
MHFAFSNGIDHGIIPSSIGSCFQSKTRGTFVVPAYGVPKYLSGQVFLVLSMLKGFLLQFFYD